MTSIKLPYVQAFADRHGRARYYFRKRGFKRVALPGLPGSADFMAAYQAALGKEPASPEIGASRTLPGTVNATIVGFYSSPSFLVLKPTTKSTYRGILEAFRAKNGDKQISTLERRHILNLLADKADKPGAQRNLLRMLKMLLSYAVEQGLRPDNPAATLKLAKPKGDGFHTWNEDEIARFEAHHAIGTRARLALAMLLYTAQRRSDIIRMGRQNIRNGMIAVKQSKTGASLEIPVHPALAAVIEATPHQHLTFLVTEYGKPFTANGFTNWFRSMCDKAGLPPECAAHGLRKAACRRLAEAGCSANVIASISGHKTLREVERYTKAADQARMARAGIAATVTAFPAGTKIATSGVKPDEKV
jgi:integrase